MLTSKLVEVAFMLHNNKITEKEIIDLYDWDNLVKIKILKEGIELGYINDTTI
jgi:hypothetical protein